MSRRFNKKKKPKHKISGKYKQRGDIIAGNIKIGFDNRYYLTPSICSKRFSIDHRFTKSIFKDVKLNLGHGTHRYKKYKRVISNDKI